MISDLVSAADGDAAQPVALIEEQRQALSNAANLAQEVARIIRDNALSVRFGAGPREYVKVEGWLTISRVHDERPHAKVERVERDADSGHEVIHARAWLTDAKDVVVSLADGYCSTEEANWRDKPFYARASMAQTRAIAKAMRLRHAWVMVMAGYAPTPAEEMSEELLEGGRATAPGEGSPAAWHRSSPKRSADGKSLVSTTLVAAVSEKSGEKRDGTPYTRYGIKGSDGVWYSTFSPKLAEIAKSARESGSSIVIRFFQTDFGNDIETLELGTTAATARELKKLGS